MARLDIGVKEVDYTSKHDTILAVCPRGGKQGEFETALGIALDETQKEIYVCDHDNRRVQVLSLEGDFVREIGIGVLIRPWGIAVRDTHVLVTDIYRCLLVKFCKQKLVVVNKVGGYGNGEGNLIWPGGLGVDENGDIYVADTLNHRISVFTEELEFKICFGKGKLKHPKDVNLTTEGVIVMDHSPNCIHFMSRDGQFTRSIISQGDGDGCLVFNADFFCLDHSGNIIISDRKHDSVKIFSKDGELVHSIGTHGLRRGEFIKPKGICMNWKGVIYVVSENPEQVLQAF